VRFVSYNIQFSRGRDGRYDLARIAAAVDGAEVIALQEVVRGWPQLDRVDQVAGLAELLPGYHWIYAPALDLDDSETRPDGMVHNRRRQFGNMLLARAPIRTSRVHSLPKLGTVNVQTSQRVALEGLIETPAGPLRIYSTHLSHSATRERRLQVEALLEIHRAAPATGGVLSGPPGSVDFGGGEWPLPADAVLMGDFNLETGEPAYDLLVGENDPIYGRVHTRDGFVDAWVAAGHAESDGVTCPYNPGSHAPHDMRIDYGFVSAGLATRIRRAWIDEAAEGSDHQPFWFELDMD
jgi:endonuclease/exonuclease/phosphatase family metal-dependent hydrolase